MRPYEILRAALAILALCVPGTAVSLALAAENASGGTETEEVCHQLDDAAASDPVCISSDTFFPDVCRAIDVYARHNDLPPAFFARLIWQESRFDPSAISIAGAQGIAQFMPGTARLRGLERTFQPAEALAYSADYLAFLNDKYGNLGLAAAAYNSGEGRVSRWQARGGYLPAETRSYVMTITGVPVEAWQAGGVEPVDYSLQPDTDFLDACTEMAKSQPMPDLMEAGAPWRPWGVLLAQNWTPDVAAAAFERIQGNYPGILEDEAMLMLTVRNPNFGPAPRYSAMVGRDSRGDAQALCNRLQAAGGPCVVVKNAR